MMNDTVLKNLFSIARQSNRMVYEIIDYFGDYLSIEELEYWIVFDVVRNAEVNGVNIKGLSLEDAVERIDQKVKERQLKWKRSK